MDHNENPYDLLLNWVSENLPNHQLASSTSLLNMIRDLDYGFMIHGSQTKGYNVDNVKKTLETIINNHNTAMDAKDNIDKLPTEDFIEYANMKDSAK